MVSILMKSPHEVAQDIAKRSQAKRLSLNLSQQSLSQKSGVSYSTLKKFERTGQISLESLLKIALALDEFDQFDNLFSKREEDLPASIDQLFEEQKTRQRGRK